MTKVKDNKGGRPKLADYQKRTKLVRIMFCENDFIYILSKASKAGLSVSEYCHQAAMDNHIRETISPELAKQIRDLSGIANNVNQIAHQMHIEQIHRRFLKSSQCRILMADWIQIKVFLLFCSLYLRSSFPVFNACCNGSIYLF